MDIQETVRAFNALPRPPKTQSGLAPNHWQFAVRHVPFSPPGDIVFIVNPPSRFSHYEGPTQISSLASIAEQAKVIVPLLLQAFIKQLGHGPGGQSYDSRILPFAPWSWATDNAELARALEERLRSVGVCKELCKVEVANEENTKIVQETWDKVFAVIKEMCGPQCNLCGKSPGKTGKLLLCGGCRKVEYCSRDCQKKDWKDHNNHKIACKYLAGDRKTAMEPHYFYHQIARHTPEAQELARAIGLQLPGQGDTGMQPLILPIRRLVNTGKDTPENILAFFGKVDAEKAIFKQQRMEMLLNPPPGSPTYTMSAHFRSKEPSVVPTPRAASAEELAELQEIRDMQEIIRRHMGSRNMSTISAQDMGAILTANFAANWTEKTTLYQTAVNAMDQGVPVGGRRG